LKAEDLMSQTFQPITSLSLDLSRPQILGQFIKEKTTTTTQEETSLSFSNYDFSVQEPFREAELQGAQDFTFDPVSKKQEELLELGTKHGLMEGEDEEQEREFQGSSEMVTFLCPYIEDLKFQEREEMEREGREKVRKAKL